MPALCQHTLFEFEECDAAQIQRAASVRRAMQRAVRLAGGTIVKSVFHNFSPYGVSGVVVITESHVTVHTWPEFGYAAVDVLSCNPRLDHAVVAAELRSAFRSSRVRSRSFRRGPTRSSRVGAGARTDLAPKPAKKLATPA
jgi:S-adenosylmethionine decarboxylase proenzyme